MAAVDNANMLSVTTEVAVQCILASYATAGKHPLMLWGPPGIGKTAIVYEAAKQIGGDVIDFRLVTTEPVDLRGYPVPIKDKDGNPIEMRWVPAGLLPDKDSAPRGILFLDELPQAPTINMNAASELIYDRRLGNDYVLPDGWMVVCAGNRRSDRAGTIEMPTHTKNRLVHLEVKADVKTWAKWAKDAGLHEGMVEFVEQNPKLFHAFTADTVAFPTPRTWEFVSNYLQNGAGFPKEVQRAVIAGCIGKGAMVELEQHLDRGKGLARYEDIVADPSNAPTGDTSSQSYALIGMVAKSAQREHLDQIVTYYMRHRRELVKAAVHRMMIEKSEFLTHKKFKEYCAGFGSSEPAA